MFSLASLRTVWVLACVASLPALVLAADKEAWRNRAIYQLVASDVC